MRCIFNPRLAGLAYQSTLELSASRPMKHNTPICNIERRLTAKQATRSKNSHSKIQPQLTNILFFEMHVARKSVYITTNAYDDYFFLLSFLRSFERPRQDRGFASHRRHLGILQKGSRRTKFPLEDEIKTSYMTLNHPHLHNSIIQQQPKH
ncbi:hypothetical protein, unlikely [Trypanosoma brucei gambiense DAL972]|uniref:Uncharacterized protein n=1 Tax=Trypanosoma brucei gambiense (strain MHOM/CI/86/DAL972) TaxID=679716 RepID=C9ZNG5_TRYB9|nr:hypothetical protein, unlikely [Trypanosoma brucei gambiense DAL972]CBH10943.1 hypothetical protein, unlikely [Trypanosoma brucei gambiense DAL972]|eukprot:XP_011773230.1 hypothetical protein, unlikely [Trypanosoma brucei gambiense DAL972]